MVTITTPGVSPGALTSTMAKGAASNAQPFAVEALGGESIPLPTMLVGVTATFDGMNAGLFFVSPGLIIAELPAGVALPAAEMIIENGGTTRAASTPLQIQVSEHSRGIFTLTQDGQGQAIVVHAGTADLAAPIGAIGNRRPATEGDDLTIYANGLGPVDPPIEDGHNSCEPDGVCLPDGSNVVLRHTLTNPIIRIGGVEVPAENVLFSGSSAQRPDNARRRTSPIRRH